MRIDARVSLFLAKINQEKQRKKGNTHEKKNQKEGVLFGNTGPLYADPLGWGKAARDHPSGKGAGEGKTGKDRFHTLRKGDGHRLFSQNRKGKGDALRLSRRIRGFSL